MKTSAKLVAGIIVSSPLTTLASQSSYHPLSFYHTHTGEKLTLNFNLETGRPAKARQLRYFLRDFRTGDTHPIDPQLLNILCCLQKETNSSGIFEVISGYRSPATNAKLRKTSKGVAQKSLHLEGRAIDIRLSDIPTEKLRTVACDMKSGGVGYYARSDFLHIDTGRVRTW
ncbi:MAG: YcbK family protein [Desulforhopalus sp.]